MLTPIDIQNKEFEVKFRGYSTDDVDDFMDMLSKDFEKQYKENIELRDKVSMLNETLERYKTMESTLQNSILLAQSTSDEVRRNANSQAENIVREAQMRADDIIKNAQSEIVQAKADLNAVKMEVSGYKARIKGLCSSLKDMIDRFGE